MEIRQAEIGDLPVMAKCGRYFHDISSYGKLMGYDEIRIQGNLLGLINSPISILLNAWEGDVLMGMLAGLVINNLYDPQELVGQCLFLAVLPDYQKKKVSNALMVEFDKWAIAQGAMMLTYSGYSEKFITSMKRRGYTQVEVTLMKRIGEDNGIPV